MGKMDWWGIEQVFDDNIPPYLSQYLVSGIATFNQVQTSCPM